MSPLLRVLRPHQWSKNLLLLLPLAFAHRLQESEGLWAVLQAIGAFSLMASAIYVMNDADDVVSDRAHPGKRTRPFAAGELPLHWAPWLCGGLALLSLAASLGLPSRFTTLLAVYAAANVLYSRVLKRLPGIDILFLTLMYLLRIHAGGLATQIPVSGWLFAVSFCFFLSLAVMKRSQELLALPPATVQTANARGYRTQDLGWLNRLGPGAGGLATLLLGLYVWRSEAVSIYASPQLLWLLLPLFGGWLLRVWRLTLSGNMQDDPVLFTLRDPWSVLAGCLTLILVQVAYTWG